MQFIGLERWDGQQRGIVWWNRRDRVCLGIPVLARSRAQALTGLLHVSTEGLGRIGAVLVGVLVGETRPLGVVTSFGGG